MMRRSLPSSVTGTVRKAPSAAIHHLPDRAQRPSRLPPRELVCPLVVDGRQVHSHAVQLSCCGQLRVDDRGVGGDAGAKAPRHRPGECRHAVPVGDSVAKAETAAQRTTSIAIRLPELRTRPILLCPPRARHPPRSLEESRLRSCSCDHSCSCICGQSCSCICGCLCRCVCIGSCIRIRICSCTPPPPCLLPRGIRLPSSPAAPPGDCQSHARARLRPTAPCDVLSRCLLPCQRQPPSAPVASP